MKLKMLFSVAALAICAAQPVSAEVVTGVGQSGYTKEGVFKQGMHVVITGSGSALPDPVRGGASVAVTIDGTVLQFDMGRGALENGMKAGLIETDIDHIFFTHLHFDHTASFGYYAISNWIAGRQKPVDIYGPEGTEAMLAGIYQANASNVDFGHDVYKNWPADAPGRIVPEPPYIAKDSTPGVLLVGKNFKVTAMATVHYTYPGAKQHSLAYRVDSPYGSVVISGDVGPMPEMSVFAKDADILIHEVQRPDPGMATGGKISNKSFTTTTTGKPRHGGGHTSPTDVGVIARDANAKMLVAYHLPPYTSGDAAVRLSSPYTGTFPGFQIWGDYVKAISKSYSGKIVIAEDAMVFEVKPSAPAK